MIKDNPLFIFDQLLIKDLKRNRLLIEYCKWCVINCWSRMDLKLLEKCLLKDLIRDGASDYQKDPKESGQCT